MNLTKINITRSISILFIMLTLSAFSLAASPRLPIIFVHGMLASGDTYAGQISRFEANGYDGKLLFAYDWNSLSFGRGGAADGLQQMVDSVLSQTKSSKVFLVGHSAGSGLVYNYCKDSTRVNKIAGVVLIGGFKQDTTAGFKGEIPTLNIFSEGDLVVKGGSEIPGATNIRLKEDDHYEVATGTLAFDAMYRFVTGGQTASLEALHSDEPVFLAGKALSLGNNAPIAGGKVSVYQLNPLSGERVKSNPDAIYEVDINGHWGTFMAIKGAAYEFMLQGPDSADRPIHYFREQVQGTNRNVYLRSIPTSGMMSMMFSGIPEDSLPALAVFSSNKAILNGRDILLVDGKELTGTDFFKPSRTTIAMFLYDGNGNRQSDLTGVGLFNMQGVFLAGIDVAFEVAPKPIQLELNNRLLNIRRIPSRDGVTVPVFD